MSLVLSEDDFDKFHTELGLTMKIIKHQKEDADKINLDLEFEIQEGDVDIYWLEGEKIDLTERRRGAILII